MNLKDLARRIPDAVRSERLLTPDDPILRAQGNAANIYMQLLFAVWFEFVEPYGQKNINCPQCLGRILENFRAMRPSLLELEKEYRILQQL